MKGDGEVGGGFRYRIMETIPAARCEGRVGRLSGAAASLTIRALPWQHAFCPAAPYLAAPTDPSLARPPLVTEGHFLWTASGNQNRI